jgi:hypothetical protein
MSVTRVLCVSAVTVYYHSVSATGKASGKGCVLSLCTAVVVGCSIVSQLAGVEGIGHGREDVPLKHGLTENSCVT